MTKIIRVESCKNCQYISPEVDGTHKCKHEKAPLGNMGNSAWATQEKLFRLCPLEDAPIEKGCESCGKSHYCVFYLDHGLAFCSSWQPKTEKEQTMDEICFVIIVALSIALYFNTSDSKITKGKQFELDGKIYTWRQVKEQPCGKEMQTMFKGQAIE